MIERRGDVIGISDFVDLNEKLRKLTDREEIFLKFYYILMGIARNKRRIS